MKTITAMLKWMGMILTGYSDPQLEIDVSRVK